MLQTHREMLSISLKHREVDENLAGDGAVAEHRPGSEYSNLRSFPILLPPCGELSAPQVPQHCLLMTWHILLAEGKQPSGRSIKKRCSKESHSGQWESLGAEGLHIGVNDVEEQLLSLLPSVVSSSSFPEEGAKWSFYRKFLALIVSS